MEGTSSTPHLLTDVRFSVSRKGYDPDEVDNFLERVSGAVAQLQDKLRHAAAQAESAEVRATEAARARDGLNQRIQELEAELAATREAVAGAPMPTLDPAQEVERASTVLVMAQRTADAAIEEANTSARKTLADARSQATAMTSDAQLEADRLLAQARVDAESIVTRRRETLAEEVRGLESVRDAVTADLSTLEQHAGEQREAIQAMVARLQSLLDDPSSFRAGPAPGLTGASVKDVLSEEQMSAPARESEPEPAPEPERAPEPEQALDSEQALEPEQAPEPEAPAEAAPSGDEPPEADDTSGPTTGEVSASVIFDEEATAAVPTTGTGSLFGGPDRQGGDADSPLGPPDDEADAAMRAFFEAEFDDDPGR
jgi:DivIVA domain-containing protein